MLMEEKKTGRRKSGQDLRSRFPHTFTSNSSSEPRRRHVRMAVDKASAVLEADENGRGMACDDI